MNDPFDVKAPMVTTITANIFADGVRIAFGEDVPDSDPVTGKVYHTAVFIPTQVFREFGKLTEEIARKLAGLRNKDVVQN